MQTTCERAISYDDYVAVPLSVLIPAKLTGVSLYIGGQAGGAMRLFRAHDLPINAEDLKRLAAGGCNWLYVSELECARFQQFLRENLDEVLGDESRSVRDRFCTLNEVVRHMLKETFSRGDLEQTIYETQQSAHQMVNLICGNSVVASELLSVLYHDYGTFTHSANVGYYTILLSQELGVTSEGELCSIAAGAMLHDLGKLEIPEALLTKPGKLDDRESAIVKEHPTLGFRRICERQDLNRGQSMMVYQHHERMNGTGYPVRLSGSEIHDWARICAVTDAFEALTSNRPYRAKMTFENAFRIMDQSSGTAFDREVYECWKSTIRKR